jgi:hypothetical protein
MIGAACILLCLFLIFQVNQSHGPSFISKGSKEYNGMKRDPLLDRESHLGFSGTLVLLLLFSIPRLSHVLMELPLQRPANPKVIYGEPMATTMPPTAPIPPARTLLSFPSSVMKS